jgi:aminopeptidase N
MTKNPFILLLCLFPLFSEAQLLESKGEYTYADTLRGALRPERTCFDVTYYHLDITVDPESKRIGGSNRIVFTAVEDFERMQIDLFENMDIDSMHFGDSEATTWDRQANAVFVNLPAKIRKGQQAEITVFYSGAPIVAVRAPWDGGFTWAEDDDGNPWIGVSCEGIGASLWWPNKDHLSDEPDSMLISVAVPEGLTFVGNGNLRKQHPVREDGFQQFDWFVNNPINNYNVTLNIANYVHFHEDFAGARGNLDLDYYVLPKNLEKAKEQFKQVAPMMACFEEMMAPYPWYEDGFALVETPYLGMEHQSAIAYGNEYKTGYAGYDFSRIGLDFDYIIIHETGHEWWGNSISCKDMADLWIHEGFCTYSEAIYVECLHGYDTAMLYVNAKKPTVGNKQSIIGDYDVNSEGSGDMYNKGMLILNTVRHLIDNDDTWWGIFKGIAKDYEATVVTSREIEEYISSRSGKSEINWDAFWDQYLYHPMPPALEYKLSGKGKKVTVKYRWKSDNENFNMPIRATNSEGEMVWIYPTTQWQEMTIKKLKKDEFSWDEDHFYYLLNKKYD